MALILQLIFHLKRKANVTLAAVTDEFVMMLPDTGVYMASRLAAG